MTRLNDMGSLRAEYGPGCTPASQLVTLTLFGGARITVNVLAADAFRALNACLVHNNYPTRPNVTGAMNCRPITGGTGLSAHAFGIAADLNWDRNGYGHNLVTDEPVGLRNDGKAIRTNSGEYVFRWGGDYSGNKDAMHWEVICTKRDLASGINPASVPGGFQLPPPPAGQPAVSPVQALPATWKMGDQSEGIRFVQAMLDIVTPYAKLGNLQPIAADGKFGPATFSRLVEFQTFAQAMQKLSGETDPNKLLKIDGADGPATNGAISFWVKAALDQK
jgi:hypothetical protein